VRIGLRDHVERDCTIEAEYTTLCMDEDSLNVEWIACAAMYAKAGPNADTDAGIALDAMI
jgi:hypothetical protein